MMIFKVFRQFGASKWTLGTVSGSFRCFLWTQTSTTWLWNFQNWEMTTYNYDSGHSAGRVSRFRTGARNWWQQTCRFRFMKRSGFLKHLTINSFSLSEIEPINQFLNESISETELTNQFLKPNQWVNLWNQPNVNEFLKLNQWVNLWIRTNVNEFLKPNQWVNFWNRTNGNALLKPNQWVNLWNGPNTIFPNQCSEWSQGQKSQTFACIWGTPRLISAAPQTNTLV